MGSTERVNNKCVVVVTVWMKLIFDSFSNYKEIKMKPKEP